MKDDYIIVVKNTAPEGRTLHEKAPTHRITRRESDGSWTELYSCWPTKKGGSLNCKPQEGVSLSVQDAEKMDKDVKALGGESTDEITGDDIPF